MMMIWYVVQDSKDQKMRFWRDFCAVKGQIARGRVKRGSGDEFGGGAGWGYARFESILVKVD